MEAVPPAGYHTVTPRMVVSDLTGAVQFLRAAFDATGDVIAGRPAEIRIGDSLVMVTPAGARDLFPAFFYVYVADADRAYRRALAAGAASLEEPLDTPYGDRRAMVRDPFGNVFRSRVVRPPATREPCDCRVAGSSTGQDRQSRRSLWPCHTALREPRHLPLKVTSRRRSLPRIHAAVGSRKRRFWNTRSDLEDRRT